MVLDPHLKLLIIVLLCISLLFGFCLNLAFADDFDVDVEDDVDDDDDHSLIGGVFHFVGEVFAFPFRMVGNLFDAIF